MPEFKDLDGVGIVGFRRRARWNSTRTAGSKVLDMADSRWPVSSDDVQLGTLVGDITDAATVSSVRFGAFSLGSSLCSATASDSL